MIGASDSDSGSEEEIEVATITPAVSNLSNIPTPVTSQPAPQTVTQTNQYQWTTHRSSRYKDSKHPNGYEYLFCAETGETKWVDEGNIVSSSTSLKRPRENESTSPSKQPSAGQISYICGISEGYITCKDDKVKYFCDQQKKWGFDTDYIGLELLGHMVSLNQPALKACNERIKTMGEPQKIMAEGKQIYSEKKHLIAGVAGHKKVTWSQEEYDHAGMQLMYLKLKSFQRFTETWSMLERCARLGLFEEYQQPSQKPTCARVVSIGGGPGYELVAFERFFRRYLDSSIPLELISLDLMPTWDYIVNAMNMKFGVYDIEGKSKSMFDVIDELNQTPKGTSENAYQTGCVTYVIISYVMIYVSTDEVCDMFAKLLANGNVRTILVSERGKKTQALNMMAKRGIEVHRLISIDDERQSMWLKHGTRLKPPNATVPTTFPNQPFMDR